MPRGGCRRMAPQSLPRVCSWELARAAIPHCARGSRNDPALSRKGDRAIVELNCEGMHPGQMSFGKLTLLSADCFESGAVVGSSRIVADSSGTWGAPAGGWVATGARDGEAGASAARVWRTTAPADSASTQVRIPMERANGRMRLSRNVGLSRRDEMILHRAVQPHGGRDETLEGLKPHLAHFQPMRGRGKLE